MQADIAIIGGGPAGLAAAHAILVARPSTRLVVLERSDLRPRGAVVSIPPNGVRAIQALSPSLLASLEPHGTDYRRHRRYSVSGELLESSEGGEANQKIREHGRILNLAWHQLQREMADALPDGVLHTRCRLLGYAEGPEGVEARFEGPDGSRGRVAARLLLGCDGGQSAVRQQMLGDGPPLFMGIAIWRAVRPCPESWEIELGPDPMRLGWGAPGKPSLLVSQLQGGSLSWQGFAPWPAERLDAIGGWRQAYFGAGEDGGSAHVANGSTGAEGAAGRSAQRLERALAAFEGYPRAVTDLIAGTDPSAVTEHPQFYREASKCQTYALGRVALTGDAAHLGTPSLGQGCSQAVEDALELGRAVAAHGPTPEALQAYQEARLGPASAVQAASVQLFKNFAAGTPGKREYDVNIDEGFVKRTFEPLAAAGAAPAPRT